MILVTGASGNIGTELVKELSRRGEKFRAAYTSKEKAEKARTAAFEPVVVDFGKPESLAAALAGVDRLFLLSANPPSESPVVRAAKAAGVGRIVKLSVFDAPAESFGFGKAHRAVEKEIEASGIDYTFLRPNGFMQNLANQQAASIKAQGAFYFPAADTRISHVDVRDIARVAAVVDRQPFSAPPVVKFEASSTTLYDPFHAVIVYVPVASVVAELTVAPDTPSTRSTFTPPMPFSPGALTPSPFVSFQTVSPTVNGAGGGSAVPLESKPTMG